MRRTCKLYTYRVGDWGCKTTVLTTMPPCLLLVKLNTKKLLIFLLPGRIRQTTELDNVAQWIILQQNSIQIMYLHHWALKLIHNCFPGSDAHSTMASVSDESSQNSACVVDPSIWTIHSTDSYYLGSQNVLSHYLSCLLELTTVIEEDVKRNWYKAEHTPSSRASKTSRQDWLDEEYGSVWSEIIDWRWNASCWINRLDMRELNQVLQHDPRDSGIRKRDVSHFTVKEMPGCFQGRKKASLGREAQEKQLQLYSAGFRRGPGWRSLDDARGKQRKNLRREEQSVISSWGSTRKRQWRCS